MAKWDFPFFAVCRRSGPRQRARFAMCHRSGTRQKGAAGRAGGVAARARVRRGGACGPGVVVARRGMRAGRPGARVPASHAGECGGWDGGAAVCRVPLCKHMAKLVLAVCRWPCSRQTQTNSNFEFLRCFIFNFSFHSVCYYISCYKCYHILLLHC